MVWWLFLLCAVVRDDNKLHSRTYGIVVRPQRQYYDQPQSRDRFTVWNDTKHSGYGKRWNDEKILGPNADWALRSLYLFSNGLRRASDNVQNAFKLAITELLNDGKNDKLSKRKKSLH